MYQYLDKEGLAIILARLNRDIIGNKPINSKAGTVIGYIQELNSQNVKNISINGVKLTPSSGNVNLPLATQQKYGVVIGSTDENKVFINTDGTMEVGSLNVNRLIQTAGDELILDSGIATK